MLGQAVPATSSDTAYQSATRLLCMIHELHRMGCQHVRFSSGLAPSGLYWRCSITHAGNMSDDGLAVKEFTEGEVASYSTSQYDRYFDWSDASGRSAEDLAAMFAERFPQIVQKGKGRDWAYAGWLTEIIGRAKHGAEPTLPVFFADYPIKLEPTDIPPPVRIRPRWRRVYDALARGPRR